MLEGSLVKQQGPTAEHSSIPFLDRTISPKEMTSLEGPLLFGLVLLLIGKGLIKDKN